MIKKYHVSANILDSSILDTPYNIALNGIVNKDTQGLPRIANTTPIDVTNLTSVTLTYKYSTQTAINFIYATLDANDDLIKREAGHTSGDSIDVSTAAKLNICFYLANVALSVNDISEVMLNSGSTAIPYEPYGNTWNEVGYKKYGTETETFSTLPHEVIGDGQSNLTWSMDGNMQVNGTPTPQNPITPAEVGEKTANLSSGSIANSVINTSGVVEASQSYTTIYAPVTAGQTYTFGYTASSVDVNYIYGFFTALPSIGSTTYNNSRTVVSYSTSTTITFEAPSGVAYIGMRIPNAAITAGKSIMINEGSTLKPYEPSGYKIPISFGQGTYTSYLAEPIRAKATADVMASTGTVTRAYKKLVLDSNTVIGTYTTQWGIAFVIYTSNVSSGAGSALIDAVCSHYDRTTRDNIWRQSGSSLRAITLSGENNAFLISDPTYTTLQDFKDYVTAEYNNGTPITVIVAVTTPTTETFTAPSIPTSGSPQSFDVDTTLKPSDVSLTYHGWHEHSDEKYVGGVVNKFNKDAADVYEHTSLATANIWNYSADLTGKVVRIPCEASTTYTLSIGNDTGSSIFRVATRGADTVPNAENDTVTCTDVFKSTTATSVSFTTSASTKYILFQCGAAAFDAVMNTLMLNLGSTALPYRPYYEWVEQ